jgi:hypothetical protein
MAREWDERSQFVEDMRDFSGIGLFLVGVAFGAGVMFLLDPRGGRRRRALLRDKVLRGSRLARMYGGKFARHAAHETRGGIEERKAQLRERGAVIPDDVLAERVRAQMGHVLNHPGLVDVFASNGVVTLRGPILRGEVDRLCDRLDQTRGVDDYRLELRQYDRPDDIPGFQSRAREQMQHRWAR